jgi:ABC-type multidrug transport system fused ATPase/permease subunit
MDIGKAFSFPFEDDEWPTKLLLGLVVSAVPILNFAWTGFTIDILKNVIAGVPRPMPDWSDFGDKFVKGFFIWAAGFIYSLPAILIACLPLGLLLIPAAAESSNTTDTLASVFAGVGILFLCLLIVYVLLLSFYFPAVYINFARKGTFGSCFEVGAIIKIVSENTSKYLTAWLVSIVGAIVVGIIVMLVSIVLAFVACIGWILTWIVSSFASVYLFAVYSHLFGQVVAEETLSIVPSE